MLIEIIRKEILEHLMGLRFAIACILCFVVVTCSLFVRLQDYTLIQQDYAENVVQARNRITETDEPWRVFWRGININQEPNPLKIFVRGVEAGNGMSLRIRGTEPPTLQSSFIPNALMPLFPAMDMISFIGIIMSLLAIVFGYDSICGEKHRGTLRLMISYSIPRDTILLGKWIGGVVTLIIPFFLTVVAAMMIVRLQPNVSLTGSQWQQFAGLCGLGVLYIAAIYSLAMWVSCLTRRPSTSVMILVTIWLILILAVPNLSPYLAQSLIPTKDPAKLEKEKATKKLDVWQVEFVEPMAKYDKEHPEPVYNWWRYNANDDKWHRGLSRHIVELECWSEVIDKRDAALAKIDEEFRHKLDAQVRLSQWTARVSPFASLAMAAAELTDTGIESKQRFQNQVNKYQREVSDFSLAEMIPRNRLALKIRDYDAMPAWPTAERPIPVFVYTPPAEGKYIKLILPDLGLLAGALVMFFLLSYVAFIRYDVR